MQLYLEVNHTGGYIKHLLHLRHSDTDHLTSFLASQSFFYSDCLISFSVIALLWVGYQVPVHLFIMCIQVIERYSVCRCLYYKHAIDPCSARSQRGHSIQEKTVLVGYACDNHAQHRAASSTQIQQLHPDSGYASGGWSARYGK